MRVVKEEKRKCKCKFLQIKEKNLQIKNQRKKLRRKERKKIYKHNPVIIESQIQN